jgi:Oxidoreductase family, NAD-binding Rossmann fold
MHTQINRRRFLWTTGVGGLALTAGTRSFGQTAAVSPNSKLRVLSIGVIGTIGAEDRHQVASHPSVEIAGLCDVDSTSLAKAATEHPGAFTCADYREAFAKHGGRFDAVIVSTPDHSHAPIMLTALANDKHVYGQKPLVHQLEEIVMMEKAIAAKPSLVTQVGNQRMAFPGRRAAVEILRSGVLGKAIEAHVWVDSPNDRSYFNLDRSLGEPVAPPANLDWNLWLCATEQVPYRAGVAPVVWRSLWDVIFYGYDELQSPIAVQTNCPEAPNPLFHTHPCNSTITYAVDSGKFSRKTFAIHYSDSGQPVSRAAIGLPPGKFADKNMTVIVCENGVLTLTAGGFVEVWRDGKLTKGLEMPGLPEFPAMNHWHAWVDKCLGKDIVLRSPFKDAIRMTEAALLAVKATRFPNRELIWDKATLSFPNHSQATKTIVRRAYREGFAPPAFT